MTFNAADTCRGSFTVFLSFLFLFQLLFQIHQCICTVNVNEDILMYFSRVRQSDLLMELRTFIFTQIDLVKELGTFVFTQKGAGNIHIHTKQSWEHSYSHKLLPQRSWGHSYSHKRELGTFISTQIDVLKELGTFIFTQKGAENIHIHTKRSWEHSYSHKKRSWQHSYSHKLCEYYPVVCR